MPTLMQKIRLALRGWNRRREERQKEFLAKNTWAAKDVASSVPTLRETVDLEGLTVAYLDDSGQIEHYLDVQSREVIDTREPLAGERYRRIPMRSAQSDLDDRRLFVSGLEASSRREKLAASIGVPEAFRRVLATDRKLERAWYNFKNDRAIEVIRNWLRDIGMGSGL